MNQQRIRELLTSLQTTLDMMRSSLGPQDLPSTMAKGDQIRQLEDMIAILTALLVPETLEECAKAVGSPNPIYGTGGHMGWYEVGDLNRMGYASIEAQLPAAKSAVRYKQIEGLING